MDRKAKILCVAVVALLMAGGTWLIGRTLEFGPQNVFSREHAFTDERPLTDAVAVD